jgi:hypothetical protein
MSKTCRATKEETKCQATTEQRKLTRKELHKLFEDFSNRSDVKLALKHTVKHKRSGLLKQAFEDETGLKISMNHVYRVLKGEVDELKPVTIAQRLYKIKSIHTRDEEDEEEEDEMTLSNSVDEESDLNVNFVILPHCRSE